MTGTATTSGGTCPPTSSGQLDTIDQQPFTPKKCLFCNKESNDFDSSLLHMQTSHGLFIPDKQRLIVELEVLIEYLHLVIYGYNECICCGTRRNSALAVQQHMLGKSHCRFDIAEEGSEFADFWDFSDVESDDGSGDESVSSEETPSRGKTKEGVVHLDDSSLRLPSGRLVSKNLPSQQYQQRTKARKPNTAIGSAPDNPTSSANATTSTDLIATSSDGLKDIMKSEKRERSITTQLSRLSENDRRNLMHLPASQQRSILSTQQKQAEKAKKVERRYQSRVEGLGNKTLQANYRAAGPMRPNG